MSQLPTMKDMQTKDGTARAGDNGVGVSGTALGIHSSAPAWIELLPAGDFAGRDGRGPFRLSNPGAVIAATDGLRMEAGLPIDYDHATDFAAPVGRAAPAAGWIRAMEVREGALWGNVEWTRHGAAAVITHEYRYISPVFEYSQDGEVQRLLRAALTNNPNLYLTAISARHTGGDVKAATQFTRESHGVAADQARRTVAVMGDLGAQLRELFGLDEEATPDTIVAEVRRLFREGGGDSANGAAPVGAEISMRRRTAGARTRHVTYRLRNSRTL